MDTQAAPGESPLKSEVRPLLLAGLLGRGIQASRTPRMHKAEGERLGLSYDYRLFDFDRLGLEDSDLPRIVAKTRLAGYAGLNVTHPFKERVTAFLDSLSSDATAIGAVNTVVFAKDGAEGHNTDCWGFAESFRRGLPDARLDDVVLLGAGGAGMAVAKALLDLGASGLTIFDIDAEKTARLVRSLRSANGTIRIEAAEELEAPLSRAAGLVNATPIGMAKYPGLPVDPRLLRPSMWIADIIYFPAETELLRAARAAGCRALPGAGMAIFQAVRAFELITGAAPDPEQMARHFEAAGDHALT
jgi:shikimate dehydrogenase